MGDTRTVHVGGSFFGLWLLIFLVVKIGGTALANWSWLWVFFPLIPVIVLFCQKMGWL